ncbi:hypothetical protein ABT224_08400 [Streptomyces sp. NPDC001584]|uniref:hypothetical protein n=1 Tax=Streptomyces sp. NPDC001584 TaxID=3154521 RepID=UPI0033332BAC
MRASLYRVMGTQMCLREDGTFVWAPDASDVIRDISEAPGSLREIYVGNYIRKLAHFASPEAPWYDQPSYKVIKESVELVAMGVDLFGLAISLNTWISGAPSPQDPILRNLTQLHAEMKNIQDVQLASWVTSREENLAFLRAYSTTALRSVADVLQAIIDSKSSPQVILNQPYWAAKLALADNQSGLAVNTLMDPGYWMRPYSIPAISTKGDPTPYYTGWMSHIPDRAPVNGFNQVWDHRWALPALLYAVGVRISVLKVVHPFDIHPAISEIQGYAQFLDNIWSRMYAGVRCLKFDNYSASQIHELRQRGHVPTFAVDLNGGDFAGGIALMGQFDKPYTWWWTGPLPEEEYIRPYPPTEAGAKNFVQMISETWGYNHICRSIGLPELLVFISELHALSDPSRKLPFKDWHGLVTEIISDRARWKDVLVAASVSGSNPNLREDEKASRAFDIYCALHAGDGEAAEVVDQCAEELIRIAARRRKLPGFAAVDY